MARCHRRFVRPTTSGVCVAFDPRVPRQLCLTSAPVRYAWQIPRHFGTILPYYELPHTNLAKRESKVLEEVSSVCGTIIIHVVGFTFPDGVARERQRNFCE